MNLEESKELPQAKLNPEDQSSEFNFTNDKAIPLTKLKKASYLMAPIALSQFLYGLYGQSFYPGGFQTTLTVNGIISIMIAFMNLRWSGRKAQSEKEIFRAHGNNNEGSLGTLFVFITSLLASAGSVVMLFNLYFQRDYMNEYLTATYSDSTLWNENFAGRNLRDLQDSLGLGYAIYSGFQLLLLAYYFLSAEISYTFAKSDDVAMSRLISVSNVFMFAFSLALIWMLGHAMVYDDHEKLSQLFPEWIIKLLMTNAFIIAGLSFAVWITNYKKSKVGYFVLTIMLGFTVLIQVPLTGNAVKSSRDVYEFYKNTDNNQQWASSMGYVNERELKQIGCPSKYLEGDVCPNSLKFTNWENNLSLNGEEIQCLNTYCAGLLGQLYADEYLTISNLGLLSILSNVLVMIGLFYFWSRDVQTTETKSKKEFLYLGLMLLAMSGFFFSKAAYNKPYIQQYPGDFSKVQLDTFGAAYPIISQLTSAYTQNYEEMMRNEIYDFVLNHNHKYLIFTVPANNSDTVIVHSRGSIKSTYDDFYDQVKKLNHSIGFVWIKVEHIERLTMTLYINNSTSQRVQKTYLGNSKLSDYQNAFDPEVGIYATANVSELYLENVMRKNYHIFALQYYETADWYESDYHWEVANSQAFNFASQLAYAINPNVTLPNATDKAVSDKFNQLISGHSYKYVTTKLTKNASIVLDKVGDKSATYLNFVASLPDSEFRVSLYDFAYEDRKRPVAVYWGTQYVEKNWTGVLGNYSRSFMNASIAILPAGGYTDLDLNVFTLFGAVADPNIRKNISAVIIKDLEDYWKGF